ncbi:MAG: transposase [Stenotrophobium sp.]
MATKLPLVIKEKYLLNGKEVTLDELSSERAIVLLPGAEGACIARPQDLKPVPVELGYASHAHLLIPQVEWGKLVSLRDALESTLQLSAGTTNALKRAAQGLGYSERQMFRYMKIYRLNPSIFALMAAKSGRPAGTKFLGLEREKLIERCIEEHYLKRERPSVAQLHDAIRKLCCLEGLQAPCMKSVSLRVRRLGLEIKLKRREGGKTAKEIIKGVPGHVEVEGILHRIEIDHTLVDVILRADTPMREVIGRPWLTVAIDCKTRMVLGFYLSFERPSVSSVAACLAMAALPKESWLSEMGIACPWPAMGVPKAIWVDNAMEFRSAALKRGCEQHGAELLFRPVGFPEYGGMIERLIGTLMGQVHLLPGTTHSNVIKRGDYDAEARAVMTLSEFIPWFTEQVVTQYHLRTHRALGMSPLKAWEMASVGAEIKMPRDAFEYYASFLPAEKRKLTRTGISIHTLNYWASEFSPWIGESRTVLAHFHPMNVQRIYVRLPDGRIIVASATQPDVQGVCLSDLRQRKGALRTIAKDPVLERASAEGWKRNQERLEAAQKASRKAKSNGDSGDDSLPPDYAPPPSPRPLPILPQVTRQPFVVLIND